MYDFLFRALSVHVAHSCDSPALLSFGVRGKAVLPTEGSQGYLSHPLYWNRVTRSLSWLTDGPDSPP